MSRCGRTEHLDALVMGELNLSAANELRAHADHCQRCRHELNWLETEQILFRARTAEEEVGALIMRPVAQQPRRIPQVLLAAVASMFLTVGLMKVTAFQLPGLSRADASVNFTSDSSDPEVETAESRELSAGCSQLPQGVGFHCTSPASFIAIR